MSQSSLMDFPSVNKPAEKKEPLILDEGHIDYLYNRYCPSKLVKEQIQDHILEENAEKNYWKEREEEFIDILPISQKPKQQYLRVGNYGKNKRT